MYSSGCPWGEWLACCLEGRISRLEPCCAALQPPCVHHVEVVRAIRSFRWIIHTPFRAQIATNGSHCSHFYSLVLPNARFLDVPCWISAQILPNYWVLAQWDTTIVFWTGTSFPALWQAVFTLRYVYIYTVYICTYHIYTYLYCMIFIGFYFRTDRPQRFAFLINESHLKVLQVCVFHLIHSALPGPPFLRSTHCSQRQQVL